MSVAPPTPRNATPAHAPHRDTYTEVGIAQAYAHDLLVTAEVGAFAHRVWTAVTSHYLTRWSRLTDTRTHLTRDVCKLLRIEPSRSARSRVGEALRHLHDAGALHYRPASGNDPALVGLPSPPDGWTDPSCGHTAGELRARRTATADSQAQSTSDGGYPNTGGGGVPQNRGTRNEGLDENPLPRVPRAHEGESLPSGAAGETSSRPNTVKPPTPDPNRLSQPLRRVLDQLPGPVAAEVSSHRHLPKLDGLINQLADTINEDAIVARLGAPLTGVRSPYAVLTARACEALDAATAKTAAAADADQQRAATRIDTARRWATDVLPQVTDTATDAYDAIASEWPDDPDARAAARASYDAAVTGQVPA